MIAMSIMCYLACIAIGGLVLVNRAIVAWTSDIAREVTVQVVPRDGLDLDGQVNRALEILRATSGVVRAEAMSHEAAVALLEPWLGGGRLMQDLPVPRLVTIEIDPANPPDFAALSARIEAEVQGAMLDTHRRWQGELTRLAAVLQWLGTAILILIGASAATLVVHVTRSALDANRQAVEVLYLVGARDRFIAREVEKRLLLIGFRAGLAGAAGGICTFAVLSLAGSVAAPTSLVEASRNLVFGPPETTATIYAIFLLVPIVATLICLVTARLAVLRILRSLF
jgi:cell division transport system permease protein